MYLKDYVIAFLIMLKFRLFISQEYCNLTLKLLSAAIGIQGCILCSTNIYFAAKKNGIFLEEKGYRQTLAINFPMPLNGERFHIFLKGVDYFWM